MKLSRWQVGACFVLFFFQIDAQSPSTPLLSRNVSSSGNVATSSSAHEHPSPTPSSRQIPCSFSNLRVCWLHSPPYLMKDSSTGNITGIFHQVINDIFSKCCAQKSSSWLKYVFEARNSEELNNCMQQPQKYDIVFPVLLSNIQSNYDLTKRFQKLISSPGIAVIKNRKFLEERAKFNALQEISQSWTVLLLALILNAIFGILVWALDCRSNAEEFPQGFFRGSLEGIWWAFVTMTTVGYGDKSPKFLLARVLGVVWMFVGVVVMAYLTATMTSALTYGSVPDHAMILGKKFGVLNDSQGQYEGQKQAVDVQPYSDLDSLKWGLLENEVEGILLDAYTTSYSLNTVWKDLDEFQKVKMLDFPFLIGFYLSNVFLKNKELLPLGTCTITRKDREIYQIALSYIQDQNLQDNGGDWNTRLNLFHSSEPFFKKTIIILLGFLAVLILVGLGWDFFTKKKKRRFKLAEKGYKRDIAMDTKLTRRELERMMENISEVEKCLEKILELRQAYDKLNDYWSDQASQRTTRLISSVNKPSNI